MYVYELYWGERDPSGKVYADTELYWTILPKPGTKADNWNIIPMVLKDGGLVDYPPSNMGWTLCSELMKSTIDKSLSSEDNIQWLPVVITSDQGETHNYYILQVLMVIDALDRDQSVCSGDVVIKPVFKADVVRNVNIFSFTTVNRGFYISQKIKTALTAAHCSGIDFGPFLLY